MVPDARIRASAPGFGWGINANREHPILSEEDAPGRTMLHGRKLLGERILTDHPDPVGQGFVHLDPRIPSLADDSQLNLLAAKTHRLIQ